MPPELGCVGHAAVLRLLKQGDAEASLFNVSFRSSSQVKHYSFDVIAFRHRGIVTHYLRPSHNAADHELTRC